MNDIRLHECNGIKDKLRHVEMCKDRATTSIRRFTHQKSTDYSTAQVSKLSAAILQYDEDIKEFTTRLMQVESGLLDSELKGEVKESMRVAAEKTKVTRQKKKDLAEKKAELSVISKAYYQTNRRQDRKNRYAGKNMARSHRHFRRACGTVPDYMLKNLSKMPNNKGYFWKSVACYGDLPSERGKPTVLFDRKRGGIMVIHEWTSTHYNIFEKKGKDRKYLVKSTMRKNKVDGSEIKTEKKRDEKRSAKGKGRSNNGRVDRGDFQRDRNSTGDRNRRGDVRRNNKGDVRRNKEGDVRRNKEGDVRRNNRGGDVRRNNKGGDVRRNKEGDVRRNNKGGDVRRNKEGDVRRNNKGGGKGRGVKRSRPDLPKSKKK